MLLLSTAGVPWLDDRLELGRYFRPKTRPVVEAARAARCDFQGVIFRSTPMFRRSHRPRRGPATSTAFGLGALALLGGCAATTNLTNPDGPRFEGAYAAPLPAAAGPLRVVSFNIKFAKEIDSAIAVLAGDSLRGADIVALQEMDEVAVERIARTFRLDYAYYPASIHPTNGKYFGPAVLSRWPIERSWKVLLPHPGWTRGQRRTATAAVVRVQGSPVLVYAVHLETPVQISEAERRDQVMTIVADAGRHPGPVVIAGDFNGSTVGPVLQRQGFVWQTEQVGPTVSVFSWDHIFTRGLPGAATHRAGVVRRIRGASDHRPVWAVLPAPAGHVAARTVGSN